MPPRALTDFEKEAQRDKILFKAKELVLSYGVKRVSVDDIIRAAGVGKATFYSCFQSKETLLMQLVWNIYRGLLAEARQMIEGSSAENLRRNVGSFLRSIISDREKVFFFRDHRELEDLIASMHSEELHDFSQMECRAFESLIALAGLDTRQVRPEVVHNCVHAMYFSVCDGAMIGAFLDESITVMLEGLLNYLFGAEKQQV